MQTQWHSDCRGIKSCGDRKKGDKLVIHVSERLDNNHSGTRSCFRDTALKKRGLNPTFAG